MNATTRRQRLLAWLLVACMGNPAFLTPALARDTDIYTTVGVGTSAVPNILLTLDTSDSMNVPENWREYPGAYDSHVEYLWNDQSVIGTSAQYSESATTIALGYATVTSIVPTGTTATVTTSAAHGYSVGWQVSIGNASNSLYNGTYTIVSVPSTTTFTYVMTGSPAASATAGIVANDLSVTSITNSGATVTVTQTAHGLTNEAGHNIATIKNATDNLYNGTFEVTVTGPNTFTYTTSSVPAAAPAARPILVGSRNPVPTSPYGFWGGSTFEERYALWAAALAYSNGIETGDPGPRYRYRNYNNANWIHWLPAGTAETDSRLRSTSFNRWAGGLKTVGGLRGGINYGSTNDFRSYNLCGASPNALLPSTVFAPAGYPKNTGKYLNQQWQRWEQWLDLRDGRAAAGDTTYPLTVGTATTPTSGTYTIATGSVVGTVGSRVRARDEYLGPPAVGGGANPVRDSWPRMPNFSDNLTNIGDRGQPIRTLQGTSRSGWTNLKADLGGFNFADALVSAPYSSSMTIVIDTLKSYQSTYYGTTPVAANALSIAWRGNRDQTVPSVPTYDYTVGTPAYYDSAATNLKLNTGTVTTVCTRQCDIDSDPGTAGNQAANAASPNPDGSNSNRYWVKSGATCQSVSVTGSDCSTAPAACGTPNTGSNYVNANYTGCGWTGRSSLYVEGEGTWYYGGTCSGSCRGQGYVVGAADCGAGSSSTTYCTAGGSTVIRSGTTMTNAVLNSATSGCGDKSDLSQNCPTREGFAGCYYVSGTDPCSDRSVTSGGGTSDFNVHSMAFKDDYLYHDCKADNGTTSNPGSCFMTGQNNIPHSTSYSASCASSNQPYVGTDPGLSYPAVDMYSVNYLNWKFGPKGPNGHPIGRKTRLQIAKDALVGLIEQTNGVRFGLEVFNKSAACMSTFGVATAGSTSLTVSSNPGFVVGNNITIKGAGAAGADLNTTITAIAGTTFTVGTAPTRSVGVTAVGPTTAGVNTITLDTDPGFSIGGSVRVNGAGAGGADLVTTVTAKTGTTLTLATGAATTLASATVSTEPEVALVTMNPCSGNVSAEGGNIAFKITTMGPKNCSVSGLTTTGGVTSGSVILVVASNPGFGIGNTITIPGAGAGGANHVTTITNIVGTTITLASAAGTTVSGVTIAVPTCTAAETTEYANRGLLQTKINGLVAASRTPLTETLYEAYLYFRGERPVFGTRALPASAGGTESDARDTTAVCTAVSADCPVVGDYRSPMLSNPTTTAPAACQKNFIILVTDGGPEDDFSANSLIRSLPPYLGGGGNTVHPRTTIDTQEGDTTTDQFEITAAQPYGPTDLAGTAVDGGYIWLDELAYYMASADMHATLQGRQPVITYTIGFAGANTPVLQQTASRAGGNNYVADDSAALSAALTAAVAAIREWNPTIAAPTVPISALNRAENAKDVYLAFFGPQTSQTWDGTVKKFKFGVNTDSTGTFVNECGTTSSGESIELCLIGKTVLSGSTVKNIEKEDVDPITAEKTVIVNPASVSYWNLTGIQDGSSPRKGGTGYQLRSAEAPVMTPATRKVYTFITEDDGASGGLSTQVALSHASNSVTEANAQIGGATGRILTKTRFGNAAMSDANLGKLLNYVRGGDPGDAGCADANGATTCSTWQTWPQRDVIHSKPAIVTYDPTAVVDPEDATSNLPTTQYLYFMSNQGVLHAIDTKTGKEKWAFVVEETLSKAQGMLDNAAGEHLEGGDGSPVAWVVDANGDGSIKAADGDKAYLFFGLRRGGRAYYGFDITDVDNPQFLWKITNAKHCEATTCTAVADFDQMGFTWSAPLAGRIRATTYTGGTRTINDPVLFFGGGYDTNEDSGTLVTGDTMGKAVYVVDGTNGKLIKVFKNGEAAAVGGGNISGMDFAIPSDVAVLNTDLDSQNLIDRLYVGDMAANLWRFDINDTDPANWTAKQIAALSDTFDIAGGTPPNRKILFSPVVVKESYRGAKYDAIYVGTGDREHPLALPSDDKMFMIKDLDLGLTATSGSAASFPGTFYDVSSVLTESDFGLSNDAWALKSGWFISLNYTDPTLTAPDNQIYGKVTAQPTVFSNVLRFSTYSPTGTINACLPPGKGTLYNVDSRFGGVAPGTTIATGVPAQMNKQYAGFSVRGYIPTGTVVVRDKKVFLVHVAEGRLLYKQIGTVGGATKVYWYREQAR